MHIELNLLQLVQINTRDTRLVLISVKWFDKSILKLCLHIFLESYAIQMHVDVLK